MKESHRYHFLFVSALYSGNAVFFENLRSALGRRNDAEFTFLPIELSPPELCANMPPVSVNDSLKNAMVARSRIRKLERNRARFDAAFINHITPAYFLSSFMKRVPTIMSLDATPRLLDGYSSWYKTSSPSSPRYPIEYLKQKATRNVYARSALLMPWSDWVKRSLVTDYAIDEENIQILHPGIDLEFWQSDKNRGLEEDATQSFQILFVGGDFVRKGGDLLLEVASLPDFERCDFHIVTRDFQGSQSNNVRVYANIDPNSDQLRALYRKADVFVIPTRADCSSLAICEAMAMQLPVISTEVGGVAEIVENGDTGFVVSVGSVKALAEKLRVLRDNGPLRVSMGHRGRKKAESEYNVERAVSTILCNMTKFAMSNGNKEL